MKKHNNLFLLCENCSSPIILSEEMEKQFLPKASAIVCKRCNYHHTELADFKKYAEETRKYAKH